MKTNAIYICSQSHAGFGIYEQCCVGGKLHIQFMPLMTGTCNYAHSFCILIIYHTKDRNPKKGVKKKKNVVNCSYDLEFFRL